MRSGVNWRFREHALRDHSRRPIPDAEALNNTRAQKDTWVVGRQPHDLADQLVETLRGGLDALFDNQIQRRRRLRRLPGYELLQLIWSRS